MRHLAAGVALALLLASAAHAQGVSAEELAFWQAAVQRNDAAEYQAYLEAYPDGRFAKLARLRLHGTTPPAPAASPAGGAARLYPAAPSVRLVDGVTLDMDARPLEASSNLRLIVVPADAPDAIADPDRFVADSTPVEAKRLRLTIPAGPPGRDQIRLYRIPPFADSYTLAARAPITVQPGVAGAALPRDLTREAEQLGPVRFEAVHRDRPMLIQAAFLRVQPRTDWNLAWFGGRAAPEISRQVVIIGLGTPNLVPDAFGARDELECVIGVTAPALLDRIAALRTGDPVLVTGIPTSWANARSSDAVLLDRCQLHS